MKTNFTVKRLSNLKKRFISIMKKNGINIIPETFELNKEGSFKVKTDLKSCTEIWGVFTHIESDNAYFVEINIY